MFLGNRESIFRDVENIVTDHRVNAARREEPDGVRSADDGHVPGIESALYIRRERNGSLQREIHMAKPNQPDPITGATKEEMDTILNARALLREKQNNFTAYE